MAVRLQTGQKGIVRWEANEASKAAPVRADRLDEHRTLKIILPVQGFSPKPGETWLVQVVKETKPRLTNQGAFLVRGISRKTTLGLGPDFWVDGQVAEEIVQDLQDRANVMMVGPQGCGKTVLAEAIADSLGYEFRPIYCPLIRRGGDWWGTRTVEKGEVKWIDAPLATALREAQRNPDKIFVIFLDELNRAPLDARNSILSVIYGQNREVSLPTGEKLHVGRNVLYIAAINEGQEFGGIAGMDAAFGDRWERHQMGYPPEADEIRLLKVRFPSVDEENLRKIVRIANGLREAYKRGDVTLTVSMRATQAATRRVQHGTSLERAVLSGIINRYQGDPQDPSSDAGIALNTVRGIISISEPIATRPIKRRR